MPRQKSVRQTFPRVYECVGTALRVVFCVIDFWTTFVTSHECWDYVKLNGITRKTQDEQLTTSISFRY